MIIVDERDTRCESENPSMRSRFRNVVAWDPSRGASFILAVGAREQWKSSDALPAGAVVTDLIQAALTDPETAAKLWGPFLAYVYAASKPRRWRHLLTTILGLRIVVAIENPTTRAAVASAIRQSGPIVPRVRLSAG